MGGGDMTLCSCREFVEALASNAPAPGGGGAAALAGALGAALGHMVGALTVGKKRYADVEEEILNMMAQSKAIQAELLDQVRADAEAFEPLARAYGIPKDDPGRAEALEAASLKACEAPLRIMELCAEAIALAEGFAQKGSRLAVSDAGCAAALARAALESASFNVFINTKILQDRSRAAELNGRAEALLERGGARADAVIQEVRAALCP